MNQEFVTYEQAKALEEIEFPLRPNFGSQTSLYNKEGIHTFYTNYGVMGSGLDEGYIYAPLKSTAFKWFRDKGYRFTIYFDISEDDRYMFDIFQRDNENDWWKLIDESRFEYLTYEDAENALIDKLIEVVKQKQ